MKMNRCFSRVAKTSLVAALAALACATTTAWAAISVPAGGVTMNFAARPASGEWYGGNIAGGSGDSTTLDNLTSRVQALTSASPTVTPVNQATTYGTHSSGIYYNSASGMLYTKPTGVIALLGMANLQNDSGSAASQVVISYDLLTPDTGGTQGETMPGFAVYYSTTGAANSWVYIPELSASTTAGTLTATLNVDWQAGAPLYVLFVDDNGAADPDQSLGIDNFTVTPQTAGGPVTDTDTTMPADVLNAAERSSVTFVSRMSGSSIQYQWYKNGAPISGANAYSYAIRSVLPTDAGSYYCIATNSNPSSATTRTATLTVTPDTQPAYISTATAVNDTTVRLNFSENVTAETATNAANYMLKPTTNAYPTGAAVPVSSITFNGSNSVTVTFATARAVGQEYTIFVSGLQDFAQTPNTLRMWDYVTLPIIQQAMTVILPMSQVWKYETNGLDLGTDWLTSSYDDSAWPSGSGIIGFEDSTGAIANFASNGESMRTLWGGLFRPTMTYYFRTTFVYSNNPAGVTLVSSNFMDDGAVIYLNGRSVGSVRMPGTYNYTTSATGTIGTEGTIEGIVFTNVTLIQGTNYLAVEVHQSGTNSSDLTMGLRLYAQSPVAIVITNQPVSTNLMAGGTLSLTVGHTGSGTYQWLRSGTNIAGATNASYTVTNATTANSGNYSVRIANPVNGATSSVAAVQVINDTFAPRLIASLMNTNDEYYGATTLTLTFDEALNADDAIDVTKYTVTPVGSTAALTVRDATYTNNVVTLTLDPRDNTLNYNVRVTNMRDIAATPNTLTSTQVVVGSYWVWMPGNQVWKFNQDGVDLGTTWRNAGFNDAAWLSDNTPLFTADEYLAGQSVANPTWPPMDWGQPNTYLAPEPITRYFRTTFTITDPAIEDLTFNIYADDGAVFYLNGQEVLFTSNNGRYYMTNNTETMNYNVLASTHTPTRSTRTPVFPIKLLKGQNTLAVEVHKDSATNTMVGFGLRLIARTPQGYPNGVAPVIMLAPSGLTTNAGANFALQANVSATTNGLVYRWYRNGTNLLGTSTVVPGSNTVYNITGATTNMSGAYTIVASNAFGMATSAVANVVIMQKPSLSALASVSVAAGADYQFAPTVYGSGPLSFQWYFGTPGASLALPHSTNAVLVIASASTNAAGSYFVIVTNSQGAATSTVASLTVTNGGGVIPVNPPTIPRNAGLVQNGSFQLTVSSVSGHTYTLQYNTNIENTAGWTDLPATATQGTGGNITLSDPNSTAARRFYRLKIQ